MLVDTVQLLRCPLCHADVVVDDSRVVCPSGHSFDIARQGYVNLAGARSRRLRPDTAEMVAARQRFLAAGHYAPLRHAVADAVRSGVTVPFRVTGGARAPALVELGTGTGAYLAGALDAVPNAVGLGLDLSIPAARVAARAHPRAGIVVADVWQPLPLRGAVADAVLVVFAPRDIAEVIRLLRPRGVLVVATPGPDHLRELVEPLALLGVGAGKDGPPAGDGFDQVGVTLVRHEVSLTRDDCCDAVAMGPNAWHTDPADIRTWADAGSPLRPVTVDVTIRTFRATI